MLLWLAPVAGSGAAVLIDFGNNSSFRGVTVSAPDLNGNYWTSMTTGVFYTNLVDTNNVPTTIDFGFSTPVGTDSFNGPAGVTSFPNPTPAEIAATDIDAAALGDLGVKEAVIDFAAETNVRFEIQQLTPGQPYVLTFFGSHKFSADDTTVYSIYSDNSYSTLVATASLNVQTPGSPNLHNRDRVAVISNVLPQTGNILYVQFTGANGGMGYLNAMKIEAIPEPGSVALAGSAAALMIFVRGRGRSRPFSESRQATVRR